MSVNDVFEVVDVSSQAPNLWLVRGRVWTKVTVGDTLYTAPGRNHLLGHRDNEVYDILVESSPDAVYAPFVVTAITTYRRSIDELYPMMTGDLLLQGEQGEILQHTKFLITFSG